LHAGTYKGIRNAYGGTATGLRTWFDGTFYFKADGTPERPIVFKAAGDGEVIFEGNNAEALFDVTTADYVYLEGLILRNCRTAIRACNPLGGCTGLTVKGCTFENVGFGIRGEAETTGDGTSYQHQYSNWREPGFRMPRDFYIADNEIRGWYPKRLEKKKYEPGDLSYHETIDRESGDGIRLMGSGHVVCFNHVEGFWDNYGIHGHANDCYNNVTGYFADNACEADSSTRNARFMRNHFGITAQPIYGGPVYFIRNLGGADKLISRTNGVIAYHNTTGIVNSWNWAPLPDEIDRKLQLHLTGALVYVNNIIGGVNLSTESRRCVIDNNVYSKNARWRFISPWAKVMTKEFAEFQKATGYEENGVQSDSIDPRVDAGAASGNNPLIDAAVLLPNVNDDFTGKAPDIGPYESGKPVPHYGPRDPENTPSG
jgi:hypothetical protein